MLRIDSLVCANLRVSYSELILTLAKGAPDSCGTTRTYSEIGSRGACINSGPLVRFLHCNGRFRCQLKKLRLDHRSARREGEFLLRIHKATRLNRPLG